MPKVTMIIEGNAGPYILRAFGSNRDAEAFVANPGGGQITYEIAEGDSFGGDPETAATAGNMQPDTRIGGGDGAAG